MQRLISAQDLAKAMNLKGYKLFESDKKPFNLNIIGIRSVDQTPNVFNDLVCFMWKYDGNWSLAKFKVTTDAGLYYLNNPINTEGTALLKEMQHIGMWKIGTHKGYKAFQQKLPCTVIRDYDRDSEFDFDSGKEETGMFGINGHRSNKYNESTQVNKWSAGCQVWANPDEFDIAIEIGEKASEHWGNSFSYALLNEKDLK